SIFWDYLFKVAHPMHRLWHTLTAETALEALQSIGDGLGENEVASRQKRVGLNVLPQAKRPGLFVIYLHQFVSPLIFLLLAGAVVSLLIGEIIDAVFIFAVLQINAGLGLMQEWRAQASASKLDRMIQSWVIVIREGLRKRIAGTELVPGDIVLLESGINVPADIRLIKATDLKVDESHLTGESTPVNKDPNALHQDETPVADRSNMLHAGSVVNSGRATGVVALTGIHTTIGRIAQSLAATKRPPTPLESRLERFTWIIGLLVMVAVIILAVIQVSRGTELHNIFLVSVALAVSAIPEGLPVAITVALSLGSKRMAGRNVIVPSLHAVEGLGACTLIATDKTGTITCNQLTIKQIQLPKLGLFKVGGEGFDPTGEVTNMAGQPLSKSEREALVRLTRAGCLSNEASYQTGTDGNHHFGDTVDLAFLVLGVKLGLRRDTLLAMTPEIGLLPFESSRQFSASFNRDGERIIASVKGAAERVLPLCRDLDVEAILDETSALAAAGYRVLAVAAGEIAPANPNEPRQEDLQNLDYLGLVAIIDPLRPEVRGAMAICARAGIEVRMITGDHPETALAIARELGLASARSDVVVGAELTECEGAPDDMNALVGDARIFARVDPLQKLSIVKTLEQSGHFVAVTGDGVNDAPALRAANIGVAMGREGTDVAREAADLILADDNFASIVAGIEEGRIAYDNVRKVVYLLVSTGTAEIVLFMLAFISNLPLPLFAVQLLWLNLVTNGIQDVALAFEKGEPGILDRPPRPPQQSIFDAVMTRQTIISGGFIGVVAYLFYQHQLGIGMSETQARNELLLLMVLFENIHVFNCRSERHSAFKVPIANNLLLAGAVVAAQLIHIATMYLPVMQQVLGVQPVSFEDWLRIAGIALGVLLVMETYKFIWNRSHHFISLITRLARLIRR
ncbi:MAG: HAD-IC family P-type ATPase, partial [Rhodospirillaceae bacterium]|nr:HAD-IC family P-type ATPase [Rhodospirillaceae bacterium]